MFRSGVPTLIALILVAATAWAAAGSGEQHAIPWMDDYASTLKKAQAVNRLVMIEFWTSWCQYCGKLEKETLGDPRVVELAEQFVCARLDADVQKVADSRYRPEGYPTVVFATPTGEEIVRVSGFRAADPFYVIMKSVSERGLEMADHFARLEDDPKNLEATLSLGQTYLDLGIIDKATEHLNRALKLARSANPAPEATDTAARIRMLLGRAEREQENFKKAAKILEQLIDAHPASADLQQFYLELERTYDDWDKPNKVTEMREQGAALFALSCAGCHGANAEGGDDAPPLTGIGHRWTMARLATYILDPAAFREKDAGLQELDARYPELQMPPIDLPEDRRRALVLWLLTSSPGDRGVADDPG